MPVWAQEWGWGLGSQTDWDWDWAREENVVRLIYKERLNRPYLYIFFFREPFTLLCVFVIGRYLLLEINNYVCCLHVLHMSRLLKLYPHCSDLQITLYIFLLLWFIIIIILTMRPIIFSVLKILSLPVLSGARLGLFLVVLTPSSRNLGSLYCMQILAENQEG